jgi:hypothetical protein
MTKVQAVMAAAGLATAALLIPGFAQAQEACPAGNGLYTVLSFGPLRTGSAEDSVVPSSVVIEGIGEVQVRRCNSSAVLTAIKERTDVEGLLGKKIILAIVDQGKHLEHYVLPQLLAHRAGTLPQPAAFPLCGADDFRLQCDKYRKQLEAMVATAIALYELKKSADDPCRDPEGVTTAIRRARAGLTPFLKDAAIRALHDMLQTEDVNYFKQVTARGCGPRPLNRRLINAGTS